ncbi:Rieske (2Fe-2S) protein [Rhizobium paknamense]|uniref:Nitrite reductase/ring-hydroxylating ferredoxin subunit n=1 Tax=Rhizobium paknamense TaxID=1206817 RepID=A0ABU0IBS9_9HYPH|nr:Rieske 2Fe-2S domain-containing protein [Rhizobium paknamense]MDQ0455689.1 nitrite reductase/ring-hydroxylating ferredoxin subunit [Rhizobium paknamense]
MTQSSAEISSDSKGRAPSPPQPQMQGRTLLCHTLDIGEGEAKGFGPIDGGRRKIILVRRDGMLHAWLDACPHYSTGTPMAWKTDAYLNGEKTHLTCHSHHALFDMATGECVLGPCLGQSLTPVTITMDDDGQIFVVHAAREE